VVHIDQVWLQDTQYTSKKFLSGYIDMMEQDKAFLDQYHVTISILINFISHPHFLTSSQTYSHDHALDVYRFQWHLQQMVQ